MTFVKGSVIALLCGPDLRVGTAVTELSSIFLPYFVVNVCMCICMPFYHVMVRCIDFISQYLSIFFIFFNNFF